MNKRGFTLIEIMIVVSIIGLLGAIGGMTFKKSRSATIQKTMDNNARVVVHAVQQWAAETAGTDSTPINVTIINEYVRGGTNALTVGKASPEHIAPATVADSKNFNGALMYGANYP